MHTPNALVIRLHIRSLRALAASSMPFLGNKGVFVPSQRRVELGQRVFLIVQTESGDSAVAAGLTSVCWINPQACSDGRCPGFGLHFDPESLALRQALQALEDATTEFAAMASDQTHGGSHTLRMS